MVDVACMACMIFFVNVCHILIFNYLFIFLVIVYFVIIIIRIVFCYYCFYYYYNYYYYYHILICVTYLFLLLILLLLSFIYLFKNNIKKIKIWSWENLRWKQEMMGKKERGDFQRVFAWERKVIFDGTEKNLQEEGFW